MSETKLDFIKEKVRNTLKGISESSCVINLVNTRKLHVKVSYQDYDNDFTHAACFNLDGRTICEEISNYVTANVPDGGYFTIEIEDMVSNKSYLRATLTKRHWFELK